MIELKEKKSKDIKKHQSVKKKKVGRYRPEWPISLMHLKKILGMQT